MTEFIHACKDCKHCRLIPGLLHVCEKHYVEELDYINGKVYAVDMICTEVRKDKSLCGKHGKDFVQREQPLEEGKSKSTWWCIKQMIKQLF